MTRIQEIRAREKAMARQQREEGMGEYDVYFLAHGQTVCCRSVWGRDRDMAIHYAESHMAHQYGREWHLLYAERVR